MADYTNAQLALSLSVGNDHPLRYESDIRDRLKAAETYLAWLDEKDAELAVRVGQWFSKKSREAEDEAVSVALSVPDDKVDDGRRLSDPLRGPARTKYPED